MARVGRLAGAILAESHGVYYLVGQTKVPCDWARAGFEPPGELDPNRRPLVRLARLPATETIDLGSPCLTLSIEGDELARALVARLLVARNGSVSERLWRLVVQGGVETDEGLPQGDVDARWLGEMPVAIWDLVRDTVLRCT